MREIDRRFGFVEHLEEDVLSYVRLEGPHGRARQIQVGQSRAAGALLEIIFAPLKSPGLVARIMLSDAMVNLAGDAADGRFVADVGGAQAARSHAAEMKAELGDDRGFAHARRLHRGHHPGGRAAIDAEVGFDDVRGTKRDDRPAAKRGEERNRFQRLNASCFSLSGAKFPSSQHATKLSVTVFNSSHRPRICSASLRVIWLSAAALAMTKSLAKKPSRFAGDGKFLHDFIRGGNQKGRVRFVGFRI